MKAVFFPLSSRCCPSPVMRGRTSLASMQLAVWMTTETMTKSAGEAIVMSGLRGLQTVVPKNGRYHSLLIPQVKADHIDTKF